MKRKEAAEYLGVSLRTLDRIAATGRLTKGLESGKSRPFVVFRVEELESVRAELASDTQIVWQKPKSESILRDTVAFRLDPSYFAQLQAQAKESDLSVGEFARRLVIRALESDSLDVELEVRQIREALAAIFYAILTLKLGSTPAEARKIIADTVLKGTASA